MNREFILEAAQARHAHLRGRNPETDVVRPVLAVCRLHRSVAWCERFNSGAGRLWNAKTQKTSRFIRFAFPGCPDIMGQLRIHGRLLCVECKFGRGDLSYDQRKFLNHAQEHGALVIIARDPLKVIAELDQW